MTEELLKDRVNEKRKCPHPRCEERVPREMFACRKHWHGLPEKIREDIWIAWRAHNRGAGQLGDLLKAQGRAIKYWKQKDGA